jgi:HAD superfamily hydrolase (TIGR01509 family)
MEQDKMIKAILFDLDGVLVDACTWHYHSLNDALKHFKGFEISYSDHLDNYNGLPTSVKLDILKIPEQERHNIWKMKQDRTLYNINKYGVIDRYKKRMLATLKEKYKLVCVTNSIRETAIQMLKVTGQLSFFDFIITNEDVINNKPHPDCYLLAMKKLNLSKQECLIIEDSPKGRQAAYASGARVMEVIDVYDVTLHNVRREL